MIKVLFWNEKRILGVPNEKKKTEDFCCEKEKSLFILLRFSDLIKVTDPKKYPFVEEEL